MRRFGLTIDNLISCDLITADAEFVTASTDEHPDLFSGLRGGGGNFGVVTSFDCRLHPLDPIVLAGVLAWPMAEASAVLRFFRDFVTDAPDELGIMANLRLTSSPHGSRTTPSASDTRRGRERRGGDATVRSGRLRQLHVRRTSAGRAGRVRRPQISPTEGAQKQVRPIKYLSIQPKHPASRMTTCAIVGAEGSCHQPGTTS